MTGASASGRDHSVPTLYQSLRRRGASHEIADYTAREYKTARELERAIALPGGVPAALAHLRIAQETGSRIAIDAAIKCLTSDSSRVAGHDHDREAWDHVKS